MLFLACLLSYTSFCQTDTLRVMTYNVLNYGSYPICQGPNALYHAYLQTIVQYTKPDILGLEKMGSIPTSPSDHNNTAPPGFGDSILQYAMNAAFPGKYAYCPFTNASAANNMSLLIYNQQKLGFIAITSSYANLTDFNTYKLYYKDPNLATTHDTTYLYVTLNHDQSGTTSDAIRGGQITGEMQHITNHFIHLPNMINMGDFNTHSTYEQCYQTLVNPTDTNFRFYDPPFSVDGSLTYPADWDSNPNTFAGFLTTSTRQSASIPNSCGTSGGAKSWYDHIFLSPWIINNANHVHYIPHSYRTIGNDAHRLSISINDSSALKNTSVPPDVLNALFQMSNKYPVMVDLAVTQNTTGTSPSDPEITPTGIAGEVFVQEQVSLVNPITSNISMYFSPGLIGQNVTVECFDMLGRSVLKQPVNIGQRSIDIPCSLNKGVYTLRIYSKHSVLCMTTVVKK